MNTSKDVVWFKKTIVPDLQGYEIKHKYFEEGDFGSLDQIEFNSDFKGGVVDFWNSGWLGIHLYNYSIDEEIMNLLLEPKQISEKDDALNKMIEYLKND